MPTILEDRRRYSTRRTWKGKKRGAGGRLPSDHVLMECIEEGGRGGKRKKVFVEIVDALSADL